MKKILVAVGIVLALVIAAGIALPFFIDINAIVAGQIPALEQQLHRDITIGDVKLTVLTGLGAEIKNVTISDHPDFGKQDFVSIERFKTTVRMLPLLRKQVMISSISVEKPSFRIEKNASGVFNFSDMIPAGKPAEGAAASPPTSDPGKLPAALGNILISGISIKDGVLVFSDASAAKAPKEIRLDPFNLEVKGVSLSRKIDIDLTTGINTGPVAGTVSLSGSLGPVGASMVPENIPVDLTLSLEDVSPALLASVVKGLEVPSGSVAAKVMVKGRLKDKLNCRTTIDWDKLELTLRDAAKPGSAGERILLNGPWEMVADLSGFPAAPAASGKIILDKSAIRYGDVFDKPSGDPLNMDFDLAMDGDNRDIKIKAAVTAGTSDLSVNASVRDSGKPNITFQATSSFLDVDAFLPPAAPGKMEPGREKSPSGRPEAGGTPPAKAKAPDLRVDGRIAVKKCRFRQMMMDNIALEFLYADAMATLKQLTLDTFGGNISAGATINLADMASPRWNADLATRKINANDALSQFTSIKDTFHGDCNLNLTIQGQGGDWPSISKSLSGSGTADVVNGKLAGVNVLDAVGQSLLKIQGLSALAGAVSPEAGKQVKETAFNELAGKFDIRQEQIHLEKMTMATDDFSLDGTGTIDLDKSLDLDTVLVLSKAASKRMQSDKAMKYLLNENDQAEIPCAVKGDVTSPRITADGDTLNRLMGNAATRAVQDQIRKGLEKEAGDKLGREADQLLKQIFR